MVAMESHGLKLAIFTWNGAATKYSIIAAACAEGHLAKCSYQPCNYPPGLETCMTQSTVSALGVALVQNNIFRIK